MLAVLTTEDLPSFLWLWRIAAWSMGFTIVMYIALAIAGIVLRYQRLTPKVKPKPWLRGLHLGFGIILVLLVLLLLAIGVVGTLGHFGNLGHSWHLPAGLLVVTLTLNSAWAGTQIDKKRPWARPIHIILNLALLLALIFVTWTGWDVVQKYL